MCDLFVTTRHERVKNLWNCEIFMTNFFYDTFGNCFCRPRLLTFCRIRFVYFWCFTDGNVSLTNAFLERSLYLGISTSHWFIFQIILSLACQIQITRKSQKITKECNVFCTIECISFFLIFQKSNNIISCQIFFPIFLIRHNWVIQSKRRNLTNHSTIVYKIFEINSSFHVK